MYDLYSAVVYSAIPSNAYSVWINGVQTVKNKKPVHQDLMKTRKELDKEMTDFRRMEEIQSQQI